MNRSRMFRWVGATVIAVAMVVQVAAMAEKPIPTALAASDAGPFLGNWKIVINVMERDITMFINIVDVDGQTGATLDSQRQAEPLAISHIALNEAGELDMGGELTFGGSFTLDINILLRKEGEDVLGGQVKDKGGIFNAPLTGARMSEEDLDSVQGRRPAPTEARALYGSSRIRIQFADLEMGSSDWDLFSNLQPGELYEFTLSRATKIYTDMDIKFGDVVVKKENITKDYPGVYSVWLKRTGEDSWVLVFNNQPDIWGTRHEAEYDAVEVPLTFTTREGEPQEKFKIELDTTDDGGTLRLTWADKEWEADYTVVQ